MADVPRIEPSEVLKKQGSGRKPLLVCAYDDEDRCKQLKIGSSLTLGEFTSALPSVSKDEQIVFYCA